MRLSIRVPKPTKKLLLTFSFLFPFVLMMGYFMYRGMAPFGSSTILTVDLGQQYVDFFSYYRSTILSHPTSFFYSFAKDLGGDTLGIFAYYLMSPLNVIILLFPGKLLSSGILILTLLKYGLSGLSFAWMLMKLKLQTNWRVIAFATSYALMGWMIANQLNVIWLDVLILLPLVIYGLIKLLDTKKPWTFICWFTILLIDNYYMAWMVGIFTFLFTIFHLFETKQRFKTNLRSFFRYVGSGIISVLIAACFLFPVGYSLAQSKGTYTETAIKWTTEYFPFNMVAKLIPGSFNFDQMPDGQPNIFIGMLLTIAFLLFMLDSRWSIKSRLVASLISIFFICSFFLQPLDLLWHAGQFPVWYPYRFSFLFSFWMLYLAAKELTGNFKPSTHSLIIITTFLIIIYIFLFHYLDKLTYITNVEVSFSAAISAVTLIWMIVPSNGSPLLYELLFMMLVIGESATNAFTSLNNISYVSQSEFGNYTTQLTKTASKLKEIDSGFYRVGQTFLRTKDDPMQGDYNSASHFGSTLEPSIPSFMGSIGQPDGDGFVTYTNGTQVTDSLLSMKYFMTSKSVVNLSGKTKTVTSLPEVSNKTDLNRQSEVSSDTLTKTYKNNSALSIAFGASKTIQNLTLKTKDPLMYQSELYKVLAGDKSASSLFNVQNFDNVTFVNLPSATQITGTIFKRKEILKPAEIKLKFTPKTNGSYYLTLGSALNSDTATFFLNGKELKQYPTYRNTIVVNVASKQKGKPITFTIKLTKQSVWLQNVSLYSLNQSYFNKLNQTLKSENLKVTSHSNTKITGTVNIKKKNQVLMTTIPYSKGWHVKIDGKTVNTTKVIKTFMAVPITKGHHNVVFYYRSPYLIAGLLVSSVTIIGITGIIIYKKRK